MTDEQLSVLLRLKRFEQPPPHYFDRLLEDVHRRQRVELLRQPLWKIAWERTQTFFSEHSMGGLSYAGAMGAALFVGISTIVVLTPGEIEVRKIGGPVATAPAAGSVFSLRSSGPALPEAFERQLLSTGRSIPARDPRYVMDARPVSYEPESSTRF